VPLLRFDTTGLEQWDQSVWFSPHDGVLITQQYFDKAPDLPAPLEDIGRLRHELAVMASEVGCLIEAHAVLLDVVPTLYEVLKVPLANQPAGQAFGASFTIPKRDCSVVLTIHAKEHGTTGVREAVLMAENLAQYGFGRWVLPHPYAPELQGRLPFHAGDDARYDPQFPNHPLSRVRAWAHHVARTARVDPGFAALAPVHPQRWMT
jgi:hypothetical protein